MTTPSSRHNAAARPRVPGRSIRGFTLVELLIVIGIIVLLMSILLPMVNTVQKHAKRASISSDLIGIAQALDQYKHDWGDYPRTTTATPMGPNGTTQSTFGPSNGAVVLCWALMAPGPATQDGAGVPNASPTNDPGAPGFRIRGTQGKIYGPYLNVERYRYGVMPKAGSGSIAATLSPPASPADDSNTALVDSEDNVILYFPGNKAISPSAQALVDVQPIGTTPATSVYNYGDNGILLPGPNPDPTKTSVTLSPKMMAYKLGAISAAGSGSTPYKTQAGETPVVAPYLLWSAGVDGVLGPKALLTSGKLVTTGDDDDVTQPELPPIGAGITP